MKIATIKKLRDDATLLNPIYLKLEIVLAYASSRKEELTSRTLIKARAI